MLLALGIIVAKVENPPEELGLKLALKLNFVSQIIRKTLQELLVSLFVDIRYVGHFVVLVVVGQ